MAVFTDRMLPEMIQAFWPRYSAVSSSPTQRRRSAPTARRARGGWLPAAEYVLVVAVA